MRQLNLKPLSIDPLQHRIDALLGCQGETNYKDLRNLAIEFWDGLQAFDQSMFNGVFF